AGVGVVAAASGTILRFGAFRLDPDRATLEGPQGERALRPKSFDVLLYLVRHRDRVVSKDELLGAVWPNVFVTENSLVQCISDIRAALGQDGPTILKTVPRRGYMFAAPVVEDQPAVDAPPAETPARRPVHAVMAAGIVVLVLTVAGAAWWSVSRPASTELAAVPQKRL